MDLSEFSDYMNEIDWLENEVDNLTDSKELLESILRDTEDKLQNAREKIEEMTNSHMGLLLSGAYAEIDRLKKKCNLLNSKLGGKHLDEN